MAKLFKYGLITFFIIGLSTNHQNELLTSILKTPLQVFELTKILVISACLWNGILQLILAAGLIEQLSVVFKPLLKYIYGNVIENQTIFTYLATNLLANLLGLGSLASISGLKAMQALKIHQPNQNLPGKEMMLLVVINTAGFSILPTTMMVLRQSYNSQNILSFYPYSITIGLIITIIGIIIIKIIEHD